MKPSADIAAETTALLALEYLGRDERRLEGLFDLAGVDAGSARAALEEDASGFLAHVMDYLLSSEDWASAFAQEHALTPEDLGCAAQALGAGRLMD